MNGSPTPILDREAPVPPSAATAKDRFKRSWVRGSAVAGAVGVVMVAAIAYLSWRNPHSMLRNINFLRPADPVYQWVASDTRTFDFMPGEGKAWGPIEAQQGEIHYDIRSSLPVDTGLMDSKWADRMDAWVAMRTSATCFESSIRKSAKVCPIASSKPQLIFVRDLRAKQAGLTLEKLFGTKGPLKEPNSVTIVILARKCLTNCKDVLQ